MKRIVFVLLCALSDSASADLLGLSNPAEMGGMAGFQLHAVATAFAASDYIAVKQFSGNWNGAFTPKNGRNLSIAYGRLESGASYGLWRISALYREEAIVESNADTTTMVYYNKQKLGFPPNQNLAVRLGMSGFEARGVRLDKGFLFDLDDGNRLAFGVGLSVLQGYRFRVTSADGSASSTISGYAYNATVSDSNSRASYPFIRQAAPIGQGYAVDIGAGLAWKNGARLDLAVNDLIGQMRWKNMPNTLETANSATLVRDASGYISYNAAINGVNSINRLTLVQTLSPKFYAEYTYPVSNFEVSASTDWVKGYWLPLAGFAYRFWGNWKTSIDYDLRFKSSGIGIENSLFYLKLRSESATIGSSKAYGGALGMHVRF